MIATRHLASSISTLALLYFIPSYLWTALITLQNDFVSSPFLSAWYGGGIVPSTILIDHQVWRIGSGIFLHKDLAHIIGNIMSAMIAYYLLLNLQSSHSKSYDSPFRLWSVSCWIAMISMCIRACISEQWSMGISAAIFSIWGMYISQLFMIYGKKHWIPYTCGGLVLIWANLSQNQQDSLVHILGALMGAYIHRYFDAIKNLHSYIMIYRWMNLTLVVFLLYAFIQCVYPTLDKYHSVSSSKNDQQSQFYIQHPLYKRWYQDDSMRNENVILFSNGIQSLMIMDQQYFERQVKQKYLPNIQAQTYQCPQATQNLKAPLFSLRIFSHDQRVLAQVTNKSSILHPTVSILNQQITIPLGHVISLVTLFPLSPQTHCKVLNDLFT